MRRLIAVGRSILFGLFVLFVSQCDADDDVSALDAARRARLEFMKTRLEKMDLRDASHSLSVVDRPLVRWSNPIRQNHIDGAMFLWLRGKRPCAVASLYLFSADSSLLSGRFAREFVSLSDTALTCHDDGEAVWTPKQAALVNQRLIDERAPGDSASRRLTQMRTLAGRFEITAYDSADSPTRLRLMPNPLYRFQDPQAEIIDGALFAFVQGNDSEALVMVEAIQPKGQSEPEWRYTVGRLTAAKLVVRLDAQVVIEFKNYWNSPQSPDDAYRVRQNKTFTLPAIKQ